MFLTLKSELLQLFHMASQHCAISFLLKRGLLLCSQGLDSSPGCELDHSSYSRLWLFQLHLIPWWLPIPHRGSFAHPEHPTSQSFRWIPFPLLNCSSACLLPTSKSLRKGSNWLGSHFVPSHNGVIGHWPVYVMGLPLVRWQPRQDPL